MNDILLFSKVHHRNAISCVVASLDLSKLCENSNLAGVVPLVTRVHLARAVNSLK